VEKERPDLIIVDMALPDRDALEDIRAVSAANPVVMFAGTDDPAFARSHRGGRLFL
jgi:response regulator NasT